MKFEPGTLGGREVHIKWNKLEDYVRVEVLAGPPTQLKMVGYDHKQVSVYLKLHLLQKRFLLINVLCIGVFYLLSVTIYHQTS